MLRAGRTDRSWSLAAALGLWVCAALAGTARAQNQPPLLSPIGDQFVRVDTQRVIELSASDPEGGPLRYMVEGLPGFVTLRVVTTGGQSHATLTAAPHAADVGRYSLTVTVTDSGTPPLSTSETFTLIVTDGNVPPELEPIGDQSMDEGARLELALRASDPDGNALHFETSTLPGFVTLEDHGDGTAALIATPRSGDAGDYPITVAVVDDGAPPAMDSETFTLRVLAQNQRPSADAGLDQSVPEGAHVTLDGRTSRDPEGSPLSFAWTQVAGPSVVLDDPSSATPAFTAPFLDANQTLTFELVVSDGELSSDPASVNVTVKQTNSPPVADAGDDQTVRRGALVQLDGGQSFDPDGDTIASYHWRQVAGPAVELRPSDAVSAPSFTAPSSDAQLVFELIVSDGSESSAPSPGTDPAADERVGITVLANSRPVADAGPDQSVAAGTRVTLDGSRSSDPDPGDTLSFHWTQRSGAPVALDNPGSARPSFTAPSSAAGPQTLVFELVVTDDDPASPLASEPDPVSIEVAGAAPPLDCSAAVVQPTTLWPPDHKLVPVRITGVRGEGVELEITAITQDEPLDGLGRGDTRPDAVLRDGGAALLRAERSERRNGRVYELHFTARDAAGSSCSGALRVSVPLRRGHPAVNDGQRFDSTGGNTQQVNCTFEPRHWATHNRFAHGSRQDPWPLDETSQLCGASFLETLRLAPHSDELLELTQAWIAASLNEAQGAEAPPEVVQAIDRAAEFLYECRLPSRRERAELERLTRLLEDFNAGRSGPGVCPDRD